MKNSILTVILLILLASCGPEKYIKKGNEAMYIGEYYEASLQYAKAYQKIPAKEKEKRGELAYKIGESNRKCNFSSKALSGYRNAARYKYTDTLTYFYLAEMERIGKDYKNASLHYEEYLKDNPGDVGAIVGIQGCAMAPMMKEAGSSYTVKEDKTFNGRYDDYSPMLVGDQIFISSTRRESEGDEISGITGMEAGDIFMASKDENGKWKKLETVGTGVNTKYDEGACCFNPDGTKMYFTRCRWDANYPRLAEIYCSTRSDATWSEPQQCVLSHDTLTSYAHPAISPDGRYMYFVSNMPGGQGGLDIWRAEIMGDGFGMMENLGPEVNTKGDEMFPTFRPNGDLYYSSNGKVGMGGLDIYKAVKDSTAKTGWKVEHLPSPVNSNGDDFGMTFDGIHNRGYFSSNRSNRRGWDKIFTFECPEIIQSVKGWVYEQDGYELPQAIVYMVGDDGTNEKLNVQLDGSFQVEVHPNVNYLFMATCEGYMNFNRMHHVGVVKQSQEDTLQFPLPSAVVPVLVHNVFYEFNKANITPQSEPALNALVNLLKQNPSIAIELSAHCDYRGSDEYNLKLSQQRADAVVKYLTAHGIAADRVVAKGYGEQKPKVITGKFAERYPFLKTGDTLTEEFIKKLTQGQQDTCNALNRRTEFTVIKTTYGLLDKEGNLDTEKLVKQNAEKKAAMKEVQEAKQKAEEQKSKATVVDEKKKQEELKKEANKIKVLENKAKENEKKLMTAEQKVQAEKAKNDNKQKLEDAAKTVKETAAKKTLPTPTAKPVSTPVPAPKPAASTPSPAPAKTSATKPVATKTPTPSASKPVASPNEKKTIAGENQAQVDKNNPSNTQKAVGKEVNVPSAKTAGESATPSVEKKTLAKQRIAERKAALAEKATSTESSTNVGKQLESKENADKESSIKEDTTSKKKGKDAKDKKLSKEEAKESKTQAKALKAEETKQKRKSKAGKEDQKLSKEEAKNAKAQAKKLKAEETKKNDPKAEARARELTKKQEKAAKLKEKTQKARDARKLKTQKAAEKSKVKALKAKEARRKQAQKLAEKTKAKKAKEAEKKQAKQNTAKGKRESSKDK